LSKKTAAATQKLRVVLPLVACGSMNKSVLGILFLGALLPLTALGVSAARSRQQEVAVEVKDARVNEKVDARQHQLLVELVEQLRTERSQREAAQARR
jgi:hypothetical protein